MNKEKLRLSIKINNRKFNVLIFLITFIVLGVLFILQTFILAPYIKFAEIRTITILAVLACWVSAATAFSLLLVTEIAHRYRKTMQEFAEATHKVAEGDFSVYVPPKHRADHFDYLDIIITDFNKMVEELGSIETLKTDFFSNVSHEIKTPLSVIQNYAELLLGDNLTSELRRDYTDTILEATRRLTDLISNILKLNKLEKQTLGPIAETYDLCRQLCECALLFEDRWEKKNIEWITEIEDQAFLHADASLMELVWNNLFSNAIKFTPDGGTVTLVQKSTSDEIIVSVSDTGCGMEEATISHVFEKFYQGDTSHSTEGNGLGLALVWKIVNLMDGSISVESKYGIGSTFTIRLPIWDV